MHEPDFSFWDPQLPPDELAIALLAAGVLWAKPGMAYPYPDDDASLIQALVETWPDSGWIVHWAEPVELYDDYEKHTNAHRLAQAWKAAVQQKYPSDWERPSGPLTVEAEFASLENLAWYVDSVFHRLECPFYIYTRPQTPFMYWRWPVRVGFVLTPAGQWTQTAFQNWLAGNSWAQPILEAVDPLSPGVTTDLLFLDDAALDRLKTAPVAVQANSLIVFDQVESHLETFAGSLASIQSLTQAKAYVLADPLPEEEFKIRLGQFIHELCHNRPFDQAIRRSLSPKAMVFASQFFLNGARLSTQAIDVARQLKRHPEQTVALSGEMGSHLQLPLANQPAGLVGESLEINLRRFHYFHEGDEATTISNLTRAAEQLAGKPEVASTPPGLGLGMAKAPKPAPRSLQHQLEDQTARTPPDQEVRVLTAGHAYHLNLRIGPRDEKWRSLDRSFPEHELPKSDRGHVLTVVLAEPRHMPEPQVATLFLPAAGPSSSCEFRFNVSAEFAVFEARVVILYENRVLQTALLRSPVSKSGMPEPETLLEFTTEGVVRPLELGVSDRQRYDVAFIFNEAPDGGWTATRMSGVNASTIDLAGVKPMADAIMSLFNASDWEKKPKFRLDSAETVALLQSLAVHGSQLHSVLVKDMQIPERLLNSERIQVIMAKEDYHLPIEFCYQRKAPASTAKLCPHASEQLKKSDIGKTCYATCSSANQEREFICPLAFWGLNRVIEWHQYRRENRQALQGSDYGLANEPSPQRGQLVLGKKILMGASAKIPKKELARVRHEIEKKLKVQPEQVSSWGQWEKNIDAYRPDTLLLMVHTEIKQNAPSMEISGQFLDPPVVDESRVVASAVSPPLVLLLGCGTRFADVPVHSLAAQFRRSGAAIVVSTLAELLDVHAPRLADAILTELAKPTQAPRSFGEIMLAVKRTSLLEGLPIALALLAYGDADWWV